MYYVLHKRKLTDTIASLKLSEYITTHNMSELSISDENLNLLLTKTYPYTILQHQHVKCDLQDYIIVLMEHCKIEIAMLKYESYSYDLKTVGLKYYEKDIAIHNKIIPAKSNLDAFLHINPFCFFKTANNIVFIKINDQNLAIFNLVDKKESIIVNVNRELQINYYFTFEVLKKFTLPTLAILLEDKVLIYSFDDRLFIKIDEFAVKENTFDLKGLVNGLCYVRLKDIKQELFEIIILPLYNLNNIVVIEVIKFKGWCVWKDDVFIFCEDGLYRLEIIFNVSYVMKYNLIKLFDGYCDSGDVYDKKLFVSSSKDHSYLFDIKWQKRINDVVGDFEKAKKPDILLVNKPLEKNIDLSNNDNKFNSINKIGIIDNILKDNYKDIAGSTTNIDKSLEEKIPKSTFDDIYNIDYNNECIKTIDVLYENTDFINQDIYSPYIKNADDQNLFDEIYATNLNTNDILHNLNDKDVMHELQNSGIEHKEQCNILCDSKNGDAVKGFVKNLDCNELKNINKKNISNSSVPIYIHKNNDSNVMYKCESNEKTLDVISCVEKNNLDHIVTTNNIEKCINDNTQEKIKQKNEYFAFETNYNDYMKNTTIKYNEKDAFIKHRLDERGDCNDITIYKSNNIINEAKNEFKSDINKNIKDSSQLYNDNLRLSPENYNELNPNLSIYENIQITTYDLLLANKTKLSNYIINSITKTEKNYTGIGYKKIIIFKENIKLNLSNVIKIKNFGSFFSAGRLICLTNEKESFFLDYKPEGNLNTKKETNHIKYSSTDMFTKQEDTNNELFKNCSLAGMSTNPQPINVNDNNVFSSKIDNVNNNSHIPKEVVNNIYDEKVGKLDYKQTENLYCNFPENNLPISKFFMNNKNKNQIEYNCIIIGNDKGEPKIKEFITDDVTLNNDYNIDNISIKTKNIEKTKSQLNPNLKTNGTYKTNHNDGYNVRSVLDLDTNPHSKMYTKFPNTSTNIDDSKNNHIILENQKANIHIDDLKFLVTEKTIYFSIYKNLHLQITCNKIFYNKNELSFDMEIIKAINCEYYIYVLFIDSIMHVYNGLKLIIKIQNVSFFSFCDDLVFIIFKNELKIFDKGQLCKFDVDSYETDNIQYLDIFALQKYKYDDLEVMKSNDCHKNIDNTIKDYISKEDKQRRNNFNYYTNSQNYKDFEGENGKKENDKESRIKEEHFKEETGGEANSIKDISNEENSTRSNKLNKNIEDEQKNKNYSIEHNINFEANENGENKQNNKDNFFDQDKNNNIDYINNDYDIIYADIKDGKPISNNEDYKNVYTNKFHVVNNDLQNKSLETCELLEDNNVETKNNRTKKWVLVALKAKNIYCFYAYKSNKLLHLPTIPFLAVENKSFVKLKNCLFLFPDIFLFFYHNKLYTHKINRTITDIDDTYMLSKGCLMEYKFDPCDYYNEYIVKEIKIETEGLFIDFDKDNCMYAIGAIKEDYFDKDNAEEVVNEKNEIVENKNEVIDNFINEFESIYDIKNTAISNCQPGLDKNDDTQQAIFEMNNNLNKAQENIIKKTINTRFDETELNKTSLQQLNDSCKSYNDPNIDGYKNKKLENEDKKKFNIQNDNNGHLLENKFNAENYIVEKNENQNIFSYKHKNINSSFLQEEGKYNAENNIVEKNENKDISIYKLKNINSSFLQEEDKYNAENNIVEKKNNLPISVSDYGDAILIKDDLFKYKDDNNLISKKNYDFENKELIKIHTISLLDLSFKKIDSYDLLKNEYLTDLKFVRLNSNVKTNIIAEEYYSFFLVALTNTIGGLRKTTKGRIIVFDIKNIQSLDKNVKEKKLFPLADLKLKTNTISFQTIRGNLAICQGTRIMIYKFDRLNGLTAIAFHDMHMFSTSLAVIKNYLLVTDILKGVSFFYFQNKPVKIHKLSSSEDIKNVFHTFFIPFGNNLIMAVFDDRNMHLYTYSPKNIYSKAGEKLIKRIDADLRDTVIGSGTGYFYSKSIIYRIRRESDLEDFYNWDINEGNKTTVDKNTVNKTNVDKTNVNKIIVDGNIITNSKINLYTNLFKDKNYYLMNQTALRMKTVKGIINFRMLKDDLLGKYEHEENDIIFIKDHDI